MMLVVEKEILEALFVVNSEVPGKCRSHGINVCHKSRLQRRCSMMSIAEQNRELSAPATPNPPTNLSPPLENPAATPGEDDGEGMLMDRSVEREPEEG